MSKREAIKHFLPVIEKAKESFKNSGYKVSDHFEDILEMVEVGKLKHIMRVYETVTNCNQLKMQVTNGNETVTNCHDLKKLPIEDKNSSISFANFAIILCDFAVKLILNFYLTARTLRVYAKGAMKKYNIFHLTIPDFQTESSELSEKIGQLKNKLQTVKSTTNCNQLKYAII